MKRLLVLMGLLAAPAWAGQAVLSWTKPTQNTDGSALTDGLGYKVWSATSVTGLAAATPVTVAGINTLTYTVTNLAAGPWYFQVATVASSGESVRTNHVTTTIPASLPLAPTGVTATPVVISATAYKIRQAVDSISMVAVGSVPLGTACNAAVVVNGYVSIPRSAVVMTSRFDPKPLNIFAQCS